MQKSSSITARFGRPRSQRQALLKSLAESLILNESIETTLPKAKATVRYTEKLVTKAKKGKQNLHYRRMVIENLNSLEAAHKLVDEIAPKLEGVSSGYFKIERLGLRRGDSAQLAKISFVHNLKTAKKSQKRPTEAKKSPTDKKDEVAEPEQTKQQIKDADSKIQPRVRAQAPKRSGVRGNR